MNFLQKNQLLVYGSLMIACGTLFTQENEYSNELGNVLTAMNEHKTAIDDASAQIVTLRNEIQNANQRLTEIADQFEGDRASLIDLEYSIVDLQDQAGALAARREEVYEIVTSHMQAVYKSRKRHYLRNLFVDEQEMSEIKETSRRKKYDDYYTKAIAVVYRETNDYLEYVEERLESELDKRTRIDDLYGQNSTEKSDLEQTIENNRAEILRLEGEINSRQRLVNTLIRERMTLERQLSNPSYASGLDATADDSSTHWPIVGEVIQSFGSSRADGRLKWEGIQFTSAEDTPVVAVNSGTVVYANPLQGYGMLVMIDHGNRLITLYGNCNEIYVSNGDSVEAGEALGIAGKGSDSQSRSLYFEVRDNGRAIDPVKWLEEN